MKQKQIRILQIRKFLSLLVLEMIVAVKNDKMPEVNLSNSPNAIILLGDRKYSAIPQENQKTIEMTR